MNILLLGESGVGKSTFINTFYNHMMFDSLDYAMEHDELEYAVPSSFTIQYVDDGGNFIERDVKIGQDAEERDGSSGQSATQFPTVYRVQDGDRLIHLIDTPGIGDTRGEKFDKINMENNPQHLEPVYESARNTHLGQAQQCSPQCHFQVLRARAPDISSP